MAVSLLECVRVRADWQCAPTSTTIVGFSNKYIRASYVCILASHSLYISHAASAHHEYFNACYIMYLTFFIPSIIYATVASSCLVMVLIDPGEAVLPVTVAATTSPRTPREDRSWW